MLKRILPTSFVLVFALCPQPAAAQVNYKSTMPDGRVIYGDKPAPGAVKVDRLKAPPSTRGVTGPSAREVATLKQLEQDREARNARANRIRAAELAVSKAEAALAAGKEALPGERIGSVGGAQRLTDAYHERQRKLEQDVANARAELARVQATPVAQTSNSQTSRQKSTNVPRDGISQKAMQDK